MPGRPRPLRESQAGRQAQRNPTNHNLRFAPVIHLTLQTGVEALIVAGRVSQKMPPVLRQDEAQELVTLVFEDGTWRPLGYGIG